MNNNTVFPTTQENYTSQKGTFNPSYESSGLTKRELFAAMAMQGMLSHSTRYKPREDANPNWHEAISDEAVQIADALINSLNKE